MKELILLQNASYKERQRLIKELEAQGYIIAFRNGAYEAIGPDGMLHKLSQQRCARCGKTKLVSEFWGRPSSTRPMQWCKDCREADPRGTIRAQTAERDRLRTPEENRARMRAQAERYPERRKHKVLHGTEHHQRTIATSLVGKSDADREEVLQHYTKPQRARILAYLAEGGAL